MAITHVVYNKLKLRQANQIAAVALAADTLKIALCTSAYTPNIDTHEFYTDLIAAATVAITSSSVAAAAVITTGAVHGLTSGDQVLIAGHTGSTPAINGSYVATVLTTTTFSIPVTTTVGGTGGTVAKSSEILGSGGYTVGGKALTTKVVAIDTAGDFAYLDADDVLWTALTPSAAFRYGVLFKDTGVASTSPLISYVNFGVDENPAGSDFSLIWPAATSGGVLKVA